MTSNRRPISTVWSLYGEQPPTVSIPFNRAEVAATLGAASALQGLESRGTNPALAPIRPQASEASAKILYPGYVPLPQWRGPGRGASRRLHRHGYARPLSSRQGLQCLASDGLGCLWSSGGTVRDQDRTASPHHHRSERFQFQTADSIPRLQL